ncbi:MAG: cytochrome c biogenesis CcdA family protein [Proteobacteria bacterium]|nr:cytochrome c biogenesis CcdA family protein [Pseudomonadota bacterium]MDA1151277.1 cytochrome c biogenesis CcdA family protein [Pseudomonadota bacterium]
MTVSFGAALLAGLLSFLSPCVLPLVPGYIGYLSGLGNQSNHVDRINSDPHGKTIAVRLQLVMASTLFVSGFLTVFVVLGASSSMAGSFVARHLDLFQIIGGGLITTLGLHFVGLFSIGFLNRDLRFMPSSKRFGTVGAYFVGLAFGFGWTPCVGPVLATILMLSAGTNDGAGLLLAYGIGMGLPFILVAVFADLFLSKFTYFTRQARTVKWLLGGLLIVTGLAVITGTLSQAGFWLLRNVSFFQGVG